MQIYIPFTKERLHNFSFDAIFVVVVACPFGKRNKNPFSFQANHFSGFIVLFFILFFCFLSLSLYFHMKDILAATRLFFFASWNNNKQQTEWDSGFSSSVFLFHSKEKNMENVYRIALPNLLELHKLNWRIKKSLCKFQKEAYNCIKIQTEAKN